MITFGRVSVVAGGNAVETGSQASGKPNSLPPKSMNDRKKGRLDKEAKSWLN